MSYTTRFYGEFRLDRPLNIEHQLYLMALAASRRIKRDPVIAGTFPDPVREAVGLPIGEEAEYCVDGDAASVVSHNDPPGNQPTLYLQWMPKSDGTALRCDQGEGSCYYVEWLVYLIERFFEPWGYRLNGAVEYQGQDYDDRGVIHVRDNRVKQIESVITTPAPNWDED